MSLFENMRFIGAQRRFLKRRERTGRARDLRLFPCILLAAVLALPVLMLPEFWVASGEWPEMWPESLIQSQAQTRALLMACITLLVCPGAAAGLGQHLTSFSWLELLRMPSRHAQFCYRCLRLLPALLFAGFTWAAALIYFEEEEGTVRLSARVALSLLAPTYLLLSGTWRNLQGAARRSPDPSGYFDRMYAILICRITPWVLFGLVYTDSLALPALGFVVLLLAMIANGVRLFAKISDSLNWTGEREAPLVDARKTDGTPSLSSSRRKEIARRTALPETHVRSGLTRALLLLIKFEWRAIMIDVKVTVLGWSLHVIRLASWIAGAVLSFFAIATGGDWSLLFLAVFLSPFYHLRKATDQSLFLLGVDYRRQAMQRISSELLFCTIPACLFGGIALLLNFTLTAEVATGADEWLRVLHTERESLWPAAYALLVSLFVVRLGLIANIVSRLRLRFGPVSGQLIFWLPFIASSSLRGIDKTAQGTYFAAVIAGGLGLILLIIGIARSSENRLADHARLAFE